MLIHTGLGIWRADAKSITVDKILRFEISLDKYKVNVSYSFITIISSLRNLIY